MYAAAITDLLRLVAVPVLGWAAIRDVKTRRVPNETWLPLIALGIGLLFWDGLAVWADTAWMLTVDGLDIGVEAWPAGETVQSFAVRAAISVGFLVPFSYVFWWFGGFGGADAKALMALAILFPVYPVFYFPSITLPWFEATLGVFALTILSNTVLVGAVYPVALAGRNLLGGAVSRMMVVGRPVAVETLPRRYGRLLERPDGFTRRGMDLDVLRMYLSWRGLTLAELRADPERCRDPASLPAEPEDPGDGTIPERDGSLVFTDGGGLEDTSTPEDPSGREYDDPWGSDAFFEDIGGPIYGTDAEELRAGLTLLTTKDRVWYSPGIPFIVPMFGGLVVSLVAGDVLVWLLLQAGLG
ncbi:prepilin peptidase [Halapricum hydrolyticum]|uniref:Prepilin peptidase n=1 Tax=Halapricum hydrolyticum TaxID=2979991 RepID=A0AAE3IBG2_9EURY|nr:prepilin peptidase [Halapricum hydrolyticum]MCU4717535.1 prepilin peptidase [Halapricum hydrolyticum]MCU4726699.1 prepilin peptidase [Halapricum hydrolyticum]